jgi:hypothetical protein
VQPEQQPGERKIKIRVIRSSRRTSLSLKSWRHVASGGM